MGITSCLEIDGHGHKNSINILVFLPAIFSLQRYSRGEKMVYFKHLSLRVDSGQEIRCLRFSCVGEHKTKEVLFRASETRKQSRSLIASNLHDTVLIMCLLMNAPIVTSKLSDTIDKIGRSFGILEPRSSGQPYVAFSEIQWLPK